LDEAIVMTDKLMLRNITTGRLLLRINSTYNKAGLIAVRPSVHNTFFLFEQILLCRYRSMSDTRWYAV